VGRCSAMDGLLGLFPTFESLGGVQTSGQVAWESVAEALCSGQYGVRNARLFCYGSGGERERCHGNTIYASSKRRAVIAALRAQWPVRVVLVWHLGLLKLLPFFRVPGAKLVLFLHGVEAWGRQHWLTRTLLRRVDLFLSNSDYTWQRFTHAHPEYTHAAHQITHLGLATPLSEDIPTPGTPPIALMLGRLRRSENYKGHWEMIHAWPQVLQRIPEAELWVAGDGDLRRPLEQLVMAQGLGAKVRFWGWISEAKKQELLAHCRCLALPSQGEGFGLVYLEAMRLGRPCLVSTLDAGREVVHPPEAGLAANPQRPEELAEAVCRLLSDGPAWMAWSHQARERYATHFTARHFQDRILAALSPLLSCAA
jgi:phosphatidylinositol alpha-1,6-mannosyltransferase